MNSNNIFKNSFLNPSSNPFENLSESSTFSSLYGSHQLIPIASYPRSRNGWIRHLVATFMIASRLGLKNEDIRNNSTCTLEGNAPAITVPSYGVFPIDLLVPDIYFMLSGKYDILHQSYQGEQCAKIASSFKYRLVKTHHMAHSFEAFPFAAALIREPVACITSASFLLHDQDLNGLPADQISDVANEMHQYYLTYIRRIAELALQMPMVLINVDDPSIGILRLLKKIGAAEVNDINLMLDIIETYPPRTGFPKDSAFQTAVETVLTSETVELYRVLAF